MKSPRKYLVQPEAHPYPHTGNLVKKQMKAHGATNVAIARKIDVSATGVLRYLRQPSLQTAVLWKIGLAMGHNFFHELSLAFPVQVPDTAGIATRQEAEALAKAQMAEKDARIADLEKELAIYKSIVMGGHKG